MADTPQEQQQRHSPRPPNAPAATRRRKASEPPSVAIAPPAQRRRTVQMHPLPIDTNETVFNNADVIILSDLRDEDGAKFENIKLVIILVRIT